MEDLALCSNILGGAKSEMAFQRVRDINCRMHRKPASQPDDHVRFGNADAVARNLVQSPDDYFSHSIRPSTR